MSYLYLFTFKCLIPDCNPVQMYQPWIFVYAMSKVLCMYTGIVQQRTKQLTYSLVRHSSKCLILNCNPAETFPTWIFVYAQLRRDLMKFPGQILDSLSNGKNWLSFGSNQDNCHLPAITENILCPKCTISQYAMLLLSTEVWVYLLSSFQAHH